MTPESTLSTCLPLYCPVFPAFSLSNHPTPYLSESLSSCLSTCLTTCLSIYYYVCLPNYLSFYLSPCLPLHLSLYLSFSPSIFLPGSLHPCLSFSLSNCVCLSLYLSDCLRLHMLTCFSSSRFHLHHHHRHHHHDKKNRALQRGREGENERERERESKEKLTRVLFPLVRRIHDDTADILTNQIAGSFPDRQMHCGIEEKHTIVSSPDDTPNTSDTDIIITIYYYSINI